MAEFAACSVPATRDFLDELIALCKKHKMVLVPTYEGEISFHDTMRCVPFDKESEQFLTESSVNIGEFKPPLELTR